MQEESEDILKLYRFYFSENLKPILIEAKSKAVARIKLQEILPSIESKGYYLDELQKETVEQLVDDVSTKLIKGKLHVWKDKKWQ